MSAKLPENMPAKSSIKKNKPINNKAKSKGFLLLRKCDYGLRDSRIL